MENENDAVFVKEEMSKMARASKKVRVAINVLLCAYLIMVIAVCLMSMQTQGGASIVAPSGILGILSRVLAVVVVIILLVILSGAFKDVSELQSPFNVKQARRIRVMGIILVINVVVEAVSSIYSPVVSELADVAAGFVSSPVTTNLHIDVMSLVAAIVCFCLSYLFRYGVLLQWLQDETL